MANTISKHAASSLCCLALAGCVSVETAHQNFLNINGGMVGKNAHAREVQGTRNPETRFQTIRLANGNIEEGYRLSAGACRYYFEIEPLGRKIVSWRYEGSQDACAVWP